MFKKLNLPFLLIIILVICIIVFYSYVYMKEGFRGRNRHVVRKVRGSRRHPRIHRRRVYSYYPEYENDVYVYRNPPVYPYLNEPRLNYQNTFSGFIRWLFGYPPLQ